MSLGWIIVLSVIGAFAVFDAFFMCCALRLSAITEREYYARQKDK